VAAKTGEEAKENDEEKNALVVQRTFLAFSSSIFSLNLMVAFLTRHFSVENLLSKNYWPSLSFALSNH
jgi:hypothetical protein